MCQPLHLWAPYCYSAAIKSLKKHSGTKKNYTRWFISKRIKCVWLKVSVWFSVSASPAGLYVCRLLYFHVHLLCLALISSLTWLKLMSAESSLWLMTLRSLISSSVLCWLAISFPHFISLHPILVSSYSFIPLCPLKTRVLSCTASLLLWSFYFYQLHFSPLDSLLSFWSSGCSILCFVWYLQSFFFLYISLFRGHHLGTNDIWREAVWWDFHQGHPWPAGERRAPPSAPHLHHWCVHGHGQMYVKLRENSANIS